MQHIVIIIITIFMVCSSSSSIYSVDCTLQDSISQTQRPQCVFVHVQQKQQQEKDRLQSCWSICVAAFLLSVRWWAEGKRQPRQTGLGSGVAHSQSGGPGEWRAPSPASHTARSPHCEAMISGLESLCLRC